MAAADVSLVRQLLVDLKAEAADGTASCSCGGRSGSSQ
jgi:hypothetical protein